jgi:surface antigen
VFRRIWISAILAGCVLSALVGFVTPAQAADDYPYQGESPSEIDPLGFYYRNCTSFVAWRMSQRGPFDNYMSGGHWHHARNWASNATRIGFHVDDTPAVGSIAHWSPGEGGADGLGHVAFVAAVHPDGSVTVEEYNGLNSYAYGVRGPVRAGRYIHVYDDAPPAAAPAQEERGVSNGSEVAAEQEGLGVAPPSVVSAARNLPSRPSARAPEGRLTSPSPNGHLEAGKVVDVSGDFEDDTSVSKVHFFAADEKYQWSLIGTDSRGGNGEYSVPWKVSYPAGSLVSIYAEAFDTDGNQAVDSIEGLEGIRVVDGTKLSLAVGKIDGPGAADGTGPRVDGVSRTGRASKPSTIPIVGGVVGAAFLLGVGARRRAKRVRST